MSVIKKCIATEHLIHLTFSDQVPGAGGIDIYGLESPTGTPVDLAGCSCQCTQDEKSAFLLFKSPLTAGDDFTLTLKHLARDVETRRGTVQRTGDVISNRRAGPGWDPDIREAATDAAAGLRSVGEKVDAVADAAPRIADGLDRLADEAPNIHAGVKAIGSRLGEVNETVGFVNEYSLLTQPMPNGHGGHGNGATGGGGANTSALVRNAIRDVIGWKPKADDPKGFVGALTQSFDLNEVEGHVEYTWKPRTYAISTDLSGGVTGAQASVHTRAKDAAEKAQPLLDGLKPLRLDADPEDAEALKSIIGDRMRELVNELGRLGGPRVGRVDQIFELVLGPAAAKPPDPDDVEGNLGTLRREFGLRTSGKRGERGDLVNTVEEEANQTNYRILADYLIGLRVAWQTNRDFFKRQPDARTFFGTRLVLLQRQLSVVAESVEEVCAVLHSVFVGDSERETVLLKFPRSINLPDHDGVRAGNAPVPGKEKLSVRDVDPEPMFVEELLDWVRRFAAEEGPEIIRDGGKHAVRVTFLPIVLKLRNLVFGALAPANSVPDGFRTPRVRRALKELALQLDELAILAYPLKHKIPSQR